MLRRATSTAALVTRAIVTPAGRKTIMALGAERAMSRAEALPLYFLTNHEIDRRLI